MNSRVFAAIAIAIAAASPGTARAGDSGTSTRGVHDRTELEAFVDGLMIANMRDKHVAGATIAVVKDGALLLAKGYGYADVERRIPVDPERTLFRIGSVSKLFTWTAVMQLVEQGKLDLDVDVNRYLEFQIPGTFALPITLRHIMTHTAGFEEDNRDVITTEPVQPGPIGPWLGTHIPARVRPPGEYAAYSNYASALAAHIVERVSGLTWIEYEQRYILEPLGMTHTTGLQPVHDSLRPDLSRGYEFVHGEFEPRPFEVLIGLAPAGAISASATDIAKFMLAHLSDGATEGRRLLLPATAEQMHRQVFTHDTRLPGFALGFYEQSSHGVRIIGHGGDTSWFHSNLTLIPSDHLGIFVSYNTNTGRELSVGPFLREFLDHYYPTQVPVVGASGAMRAQAARVAGEYRLNRMSYTTFQKAVGLTTPITLSARRDGTLLMSWPLGDTVLVPVGPLLYREDAGTDLVAFQADGSGAITHAFIASFPTLALERVPWLESARVQRVVLAFGGAVFLLTIWSAVGRLLRQWLERRTPDPLLAGHSLIVWTALADLGFLAGVAFLVSNATALMTGSPTVFEWLLALPVLAAVLASIAAIVAVKQWIDRSGSATARLRYAAVVIVALIFTWSLNEWNLLGWKL